MIRSAGLRGYRATVAELGGDAEEYARLAGLPVEALDEDDLLVSDVAMGTAYEMAAERLGVPDLGLRVGARQDLGMLGPLALAIRNSPTVVDALECCSRYLFVHARSLQLSLVDDPRGARGVVGVEYGYVAGADLPVLVQSTDVGLALLHRTIRFLVGGPYGLRTVELPYVPPAPLRVYEEFFGCEVRTGARAATLRVPASLAAQPLTGVDEGVRLLALAHLATLAPGEAPGVLARVRATLAQSLGTTPPTLDSVASLLGVHPRTLQRHLAAEGATFAGVLDDVRRTAARRWLTTTDLPLSQVAALLGLSEQSALTRACRRWYGATPTQVRRGVLVAEHP